MNLIILVKVPRKIILLYNNNNNNTKNVIHLMIYPQKKLHKITKKINKMNNKI